MGVGQCFSVQRDQCVWSLVYLEIRDNSAGQCWCGQLFLGSATPACPHKLGHLSLDLGTPFFPTELSDLLPGSWSCGLEAAHSSGAPQALPRLPFPAPAPFSQRLGLVLEANRHMMWDMWPSFVPCLWEAFAYQARVKVHPRLLMAGGHVSSGN